MAEIQVRRLQSLTGHRDAVYTLQPAGSPGRFFSGSGDGMVVAWDLLAPESGDLIARLPNSIYALRYLPSSGVLVAGHNYEGIHLLDWKNKRELASLKLTAAAIFDIQSWEDRLLVAAADGTITLVNARTLTIDRQVKASEKSARTIAINPSTGDIAAGFSDYMIRIFDEHLTLKKEWAAHKNSIFTLRYSPDLRQLLSGSRDARFKVWDVDAGYEKQEEVVAHMYAINHIEFSPDGKHFVTCSMDKSIKVWDAQAFRLLKVIDKARHAGHGTSVNKLLWTDFDNQLLSASDDRTISAWQIIF